MKRTAFTIFISLIYLSCLSQIELKGKYQGRNLYVQNPFADSIRRPMSNAVFCVDSVVVNDSLIPDSVLYPKPPYRPSAAFEIPLSKLGFEIKDPVRVNIYHKTDCSPRVLNSDVIYPGTGFVPVLTTFDDDTLKYHNPDLEEEMKFILEQFRWNRWIPVDSVLCKIECKFLPPFHSGQNRFRLKAIDENGNPKYSRECKYMSKLPIVTFAPLKPKTEITFSQQTMYVIYNKFGNVVKSGTGKVVYLSDLPKDAYYINYDNTTGDKFIKR